MQHGEGSCQLLNVNTCNQSFLFTPTHKSYILLFCFISSQCLIPFGLKADRPNYVHSLRTTTIVLPSPPPLSLFTTFIPRWRRWGT